MEMIAEATSPGRINLFKALCYNRRQCNHHFFPEWYLTKLFENNDVTSQLIAILNQNWGTWGPESKDTILGQSFTYNIKEVVTYEIVLTKNIDACRIVYLKVAIKHGHKWENRLYVAINGYYSAICDGDGNMKYDVINQIYRSDEIGSEWQTSLLDTTNHSKT